MINLQFFTDDERKRELITRYWKLGPRGRDFAEPMETLKEEFGLSRGGILGIVRTSSNAVSEIHKCECGRLKLFSSRKDFRSTPKQTPYVCQQCQEEASSNGSTDPSTESSRSGRGDRKATEPETGNVSLENRLSEESLQEKALPEEALSGKNPVEDLFASTDHPRDGSSDQPGGNLSRGSLEGSLKESSGDSPSGNSPSGDSPEDFSLEDPSLSGEDAEDLRGVLRRMSRVLSLASQHIERLSHRAAEVS